MEIYKFLNGLSPSTVSTLSKQNQNIPYELRKFNLFRSRRASCVKYETEKYQNLPLKFGLLVLKQ